MVDISAKDQTERVATAQAKVFLLPETLEKIQRGKIAKGDVLAVAQVAGVMGPRRHRTSSRCVIRFCSPVWILHSRKTSAGLSRSQFDHHYGYGQDDWADGSRNGSDDGGFRVGADDL